MTHYQPTKRLFSRAAMTLLMMLLTASTAWAQFSGGDGSENNPYEIASYDDLLTLRNNVNNGERYGNCYFRQTADITWPDGTTWDRGIGYSDTGSHYFRGRYDGNGKKITGFRLTTSEQNAGLFGYVLGDYRGTDATNNVIAEVKNVVLVDPIITAQATSGEQYVGTLVGYVSRCVKIDDNTVIGGSVTITGVSNNDNSTYAGGLVGYYFNGDWPSLKRNIVSGTTVSGAGVSGGLVGRLYFSYCVDQNFVDATVSSVQHTGDAGTFYRQGAVVGECYSISNNSNNFTWGYYHNTAGLTFFAKDANGNTKNDQLKTSRIYAVGIAPSDITVSGDGHHSFCGKHYCHGGASITLSGGTNPGYLVSGYTSTDVPITNGAFTMPAKDITVSATFTPDPAHIEQTATDEYTIHSAEGWGVFCDMLQDNATYNRFIGKTVKLDKDITVTRMAGSDNHDICGTFDGCGHTITLDGNTKTNGCYALFRNAVGATIQNLHVDGTISTAGAYAAGLISGMWGTVKIKNCRVSVNILSSQSGECSHGGLVAKNNSGTLEITGCVFDGKLLTTNGSTRCGGFVGWNGGTLTISNSLYAPAELKDGETWVGNDYSSPFACNGATISNCYYTHDFNDGTHYTAQGKAPRTVEAGDYVTIEAVSPVGSPTSSDGYNGTYSVSGITAYAKGITRGDAFYYGNGDEVSLTLSHADRGGYTFTGYAASAGTLDGTTLTMPGDGDVTINANYEFIKFTQGALSYECTSGTEVKMTACDNSLTSVTIPATVTYDEVTYSVTAIGNAAFADCTSLTTVFMQPTTPPTLGDNAFANCDELANIYVPAASLDDYKAAWTVYASKIQGYDGTCGDNVYWSYDSDSKTLTIFGTGAMTNDFEDNNWGKYLNDITTVDIREGVTSIGDYAFSFCNLSSINIPASVTSIGDYAFQSCWGLTSIEIPASVTSIGYAAFITCVYLTSINIPASVTTIGDEAFANCTGLTSINIPASVTSIGDAAFLNCYGLESISVVAGNTIYDSRDNCNAIIEKATNTLLFGCKNTVIPNTVTSIGSGAFYGCEELKEITIPASVTSIGQLAFYECTALESISVADGNTKYDSRNDCNALIETASNTLIQGCKNTVIPNTVTSIGNYAFQNCWGLTNITIPASVTSIGNYAFQMCTSLTTVFMESTTPPTLGNDAFYGCTALHTIVVPTEVVLAYKAAWTDYADKILSIDGTCGDDVYWSYNSDSHKLTIFGTGAMEDYSLHNRPWESCYKDITTIVIRNGVTSIGSYAFYNCDALTNIVIPASVTSIGEGAFAFCTGLTSITIPNSVTSIGDYAFAGCTGLTSITIPASVTSIGHYAFQVCTSLTTVFMESTTPPTLGNGAFEDCTAFYTIVVPTEVVLAYKAAWTDYADKILSIDGTCGDNVYWSYDSDSYKLTIFGTGAMADYDSCFSPWKVYCEDITTANISNGVTSIAKDAFYGCTAMTSVTIPNSVTTIDNGAFYGCGRLASIDIPDGVTSIGDGAFSYCDGLTNTTIPASVTSIGDEAFFECTNLTEVIVQRSDSPITQLGDIVFYHCSDELTIYVPIAAVDDYKAADNWSSYADKIKGFGSCGDNVYWSYNTDSKTLTIFGTGAMADYNDCYRPWETYCDDITTVDIRDGVTTIGDDAFYGCTAMTSVTIPNSVTTIDNGAFCDCGRLASIDIPDGVTNIGYKAFAHCSSLESIYVAEGNTVYDSRNGCNAIIKKDGNILLWGCKNTVIPTGMISIGDDAFSACTGLTSITIPESVTSIGYAAFNTCVYLTSINIPASVTTIGDEAFANCSSLESIYVAEGNTVYDSRNGCNAIIKKDGNLLLWGCKNTVIPTGVISIGYAAFSACTGLTSIEIPASVTSIGYAAFRDCTGLSAFTVDEGNTIYAAEDGVLFNKDKTTLILYPMGNNRTSYTIPASVTTISDWAFESCEGLKEITIPAGVTSIGEGVFAGCTGLTSIEIPASVTTIGNYAFLDCNALTSITIPESVTSIGRWAFGGFTGLTSITIPACVTSIGWSAFNGCESLSEVYCLATTPPTLGEDAFYDCDKELSIYVPVASLDDYKTAWSDYKDKIKGLDEIIEIALADNASNSGLIAAVNGQTHNVTLQGRTLVKDGNWNTLCLPFDVDLTDTESPLYGATVKKLNASASGLSGSTLTLAFEAETTTLHAGVPYIIKWTETGDNITNPKFTGVTISSTEPTPVTSTDGKVTFVGQYSPFSIVESGATGDNQGNKNEIIMLSSGNKLGYSKNPRTLHTFRCHFYVPTNDSQQQARSFVLDFGDGETTAITTTDFMDFTDKAGAWYTIDGRKLDKQPAKKGLYIMNGKKVKR